MLGFEGFEHVCEVGLAFAFEDYGLGGQSMLDAVQTDGGASFWCSRAGAFLCVQPVGGCLFVSGHFTTSLCPE